MIISEFQNSILLSEPSSSLSSLFSMAYYTSSDYCTGINGNVTPKISKYVYNNLHDINTKIQTYRYNSLSNIHYAMNIPTVKYAHLEEYKS